MKNKFWTSIKEFALKLKKSKNFYLYVAIGLAVLIAVIYFSSFLTSSPSPSTNDDTLSENLTASEEYVASLENKLENVISQIEGTGNVDVVITLEKGFEYVYLTEEETRTSASGNTTTSTTVVMVDGQPVLIEELYPVIKGIVVVCAGADNVSVKMNIISLIQTVVNVNSSNISIYTSK